MLQDLPLLSIAIWVPIAFGIAVLAVGRDDNPAPARWLALVGSVLGFLVCIPLWTGFEPVAAMQFTEMRPWIAAFNVNYHLGVDGIAMPLILLNSLMTVLVVVAHWEVIKDKVSQYLAAFLIMSGLINGVFAALDAILFYVFFEAMLIPMFLIIGVWGGPNRVYAAVKFFLYTLLGSLLMLAAFIYLYIATNGSFEILDYHRLQIPMTAQVLIFLAMFMSFAVKVPMWPVHTWLPDAHVEAPTGGSVVLAGVLLKMGTYGFLRFAFPLFPHGAERLAMPLIVLSVIGILYGALVAWAQTDMKKLVAYSSVAHLGFVMLGLLAFDLVAWQGGLLQMVNHGLSTGALFLLVGMLYDRRHTKKFDEYGGIAKVMPVFAFFLVFSTLASVGLPALNGFVGEFLVLVGAFKTEAMDIRWAVVLATFGVVLAAIYLLKLLYLTLWGPITRPENEGLHDLSWREIASLVPLCIFMLWIGVAPAAFLKPSEAHLQQLLADVRSRQETPPPAAPTLRGVTAWQPAGEATDRIAAARPAAGVQQPATAASETAR